MTAVKTLSLGTAEPKVKSFDVPVSLNRIEPDEPESLAQRYNRFCREFIECQKQDGTPDDELITMQEIVAICKEARAEIYAEQQKNSTRR